MASTDVRSTTTGTTGPAGTKDVEPFDWRRPNRLGREHVRALSNAHDAFTRRMSTALGSMLRSVVQVESLGIDQMTYDDYVRSLPTPNICAVLTLSPLPGGVLMETSVGFALQLVDRMLGGRGLPVELRRPTDLEVPLIRDVVAVGVRALNEALEPLVHTSAEMSLFETNPQMVQFTSPSDMVLLLSYRLSIAQGQVADGLLTLCYPSATLAPVLDRLATADGAGGGQSDGEDAAADVSERIAAYLDDVDVPLSVQLAESRVRARDLLALAVGDVLRLDHRVGQPAVAKIGDTPVLKGHLGRRGRRLGLQIAETVPPLVDPFAAGPLGAHQRQHPAPPSHVHDAPGGLSHGE